MPSISTSRLSLALVASRIEDNAVTNNSLTSEFVYSRFFLWVGQ